jgi:SAM-dependent methyltransferase
MSAVAPDGSPVGLYATLTPLGEPERIHAAVPAGSRILELGCGAGRITHELIALGHSVTAVDNSPEMLAHVRGAEAVLADIETLDLGRRFPVVLLASHFLNAPEQAELDAVLDACARHVDAGGQVLLERMPPDWEPASGTRTAGGVELTLRDVVRDGEVISAVMEYRANGECWTHAFRTKLISDDEVDAALGRAGLELVRWLDERRTWLEARPLSRGGEGRSAGPAASRPSAAGASPGTG